MSTNGKEYIRIDKLFSNLGLLSRSECKAAVCRGEITVNNQLCKASDTKVLRSYSICYKGEAIDTREYVYYMLNKPAGVITANDDPKQKTVFDLIKDARTDLSAVGRLDKDTTGILLITNDGDLNHRLLSPKKHVEKRYLLKIDGILTEEDKQRLCLGIDIGDDKPTLPAKVEELDKEPNQSIYLTITEGRYHQVKRMLEAVGKTVIALHRDKFGPLELDKELKSGEYRELTPEELSMII